MRRILYLLAILVSLAPSFAWPQVPQKDENEVVFESTGRPMRWQNWAVAGGGLIAAAIGMVFIALNPGNHPPSSNPSSGS